MTDLVIEFSDACCSITPDRLSAVRVAGVPDEALDPLLFGMATIQAHSSTYEPVGYGTAPREPAAGAGDDRDKAVIVPAGRFDGINWDLTDLVAFKLDDPTRWWRRLGIADVLGEAQGFTVEPKVLVATPLAWLRIAGTGICLLDWSRDPVNVLMGAGTITAAESLKHKVYAAAARAAAESVRIFFNE